MNGRIRQLRGVRRGEQHHTTIVLYISSPYFSTTHMHTCPALPSPVSPSPLPRSLCPDHRRPAADRRPVADPRPLLLPSTSTNGGGPLFFLPVFTKPEALSPVTSSVQPLSVARSSSPDPCCIAATCHPQSRGHIASHRCSTGTITTSTSFLLD